MTCTQCNSTGIEIPSMTTWKDGERKTTHYTDKATTCKLCDGTAEQRRQWAFPNGSAFMDWKAHNCDECLKGYDYEKEGSMDAWRCRLERAIDEASMSDGTVPIETYRDLGLDRGHDCPERVR